MLNTQTAKKKNDSGITMKTLFKLGHIKALRLKRRLENDGEWNKTWKKERKKEKKGIEWVNEGKELKERKKERKKNHWMSEWKNWKKEKVFEWENE